MLDHKGRHRDRSDSIKQKNTWIIGVSEDEKWVRGAKSLFGQIIAENFLNLGKETGIQVQEAQRSPLKINKNRSRTQCIIVKFARFKDKEKS